MSELDRLKDDIAFEKQIFFVLFAGGLAMLAWLFGNALKVEAIYVYVACAALALDAGVVAFLYRRVKNKIESLRDL